MTLLRLRNLLRPLTISFYPASADEKDVHYLGHFTAVRTVSPFPLFQFDVFVSCGLFLEYQRIIKNAIVKIARSKRRTSALLRCHFLAMFI